MKLRSVIAVVVLSAGALTACHASPPPAKELADEVIDSLEGVSDAVKECMHAEVAKFSGEELDQIAEAAAGGNDEQVAKLKAFEDALATCNKG